MNNKIIKQVRDFVREECEKPTSKYGSEILDFHMAVVVKYAQTLAEKLDADVEIVTIAAWLHDIGSIFHGRKDHHITGAKIAEEKLRELGYPSEKIELVKNCVLHHRGSTAFERGALEEKIVAEADTMAAFDSIGGLFKAAYIFENLHQDEAQKSVLKKLQNKYEKLHFAESKKMIEPKYKAAKLLLDR